MLLNDRATIHSSQKKSCFASLLYDRLKTKIKVNIDYSLELSYTENYKTTCRFFQSLLLGRVFLFTKQKQKKRSTGQLVSHIDAVEELARKTRKSLPIFNFLIGMLKTYIKNLLETSLSTPEKASCKW